MHTLTHTSMPHIFPCSINGSSRKSMFFKMHFKKEQRRTVSLEPLVRSPEDAIRLCHKLNIILVLYHLLTTFQSLPKYFLPFLKMVKKKLCNYKYRASILLTGRNTLLQHHSVQECAPPAFFQ